MTSSDSDIENIIVGGLALGVGALLANVVENTVKGHLELGARYGFAAFQQNEDHGRAIAYPSCGPTGAKCSCPCTRIEGLTHTKPISPVRSHRH